MVLYLLATIGVLLMQGKGIAKNELEAVKYYSMAAKQGYEPAIEALRMVDEMHDPIFIS